MKKYYLICGAVLVALIAITASIRSESTSFYGIADTKEIVINSEFAVEIMKIRVMPGQTVRFGDTLVELRSQDLDLQINDISHQFDELKTKKSAHANMSRSEIRQLKVQQEERANAIRAQLQPLEAEYESNRRLMSELKSIKHSDIDKEETADTTNPLMVRIIGLRKELERVLDSSQITVDRLSNELSYSGDPLVDQAKNLEAELKMLLTKKKNLFIVAQISGLIGTVDFKDGEKVAPFTPILTLHAESPSIVRGYIHENAYSRIRVGRKVIVTSLAESGSTITGEVTGVGSRIVEFPVRLRKAPEIQIWGREIIVKIPEENKLLLGEKVLISMAASKILSSLGTNLLAPVLPQKAFAGKHAVEKPQAGPASSVIDILPDSSFQDIVPVEASGVIYLSDLKKYLVVSDETERKAPALYLMNGDGHIGKEVLIDGIKKINDLESVTADDHGRLYMLASQSYNKKDKLSPWRKLFVRCVRNGETIRLDKSVFLADLLANAAGQFPREPWAPFISSAIADSTMEIEGMYWDRGSIYLGFKNPLVHDSSMVLAVRNIEDVFTANTLRGQDVSLLRKLSLKSRETGFVYKISDMCFLNGTVYIISVSSVEPAGKAGKNKHDGMLWACSDSTGRMTEVQRFPGLRPEGICYNGDTREFCVTFDNGPKRPSQMMTIKAPE